MFPTAYQRNDHHLQLWTIVAITAIFRIAMSHTGGMDTGNYGPGDMYVILTLILYLPHSQVCM